MHCRNCGSEVNEKAEYCLNCGVSPLNSDQFCQECGQPTTEKQEICISCGVKLIKKTPGKVKINTGDDLVYPSNPPKSPGTATLLSCLIVGIGQIYLGQTIKGLAWLVGSVVLSIATSGVLSLPIWIACMVDAHKIGTKLANGQSVGQWDFF